MRKFSGSFLIVLLGIGLVLGLGGCAQGTSTTVSTTANPVQAYADPATTVTLQGLSENDLAKYTQYCDAAMKGAVTVDILSATSKQITSQYGQFQSIQFISTENSNGLIIVHYKAKYSKGDLKVRMVFDADHLVAGQWFE